MMKRRRFDKIRLDIDKSKRRESDGALVVPGRFARTGLQSYQNSDGSERIEYRPRDEVIASADTFEGVSITDRHPDGGEFISPDNWQRLARGHMQGVRVVDNGPDDELWLESDLVISAGDLADAVERGDRSELSAGYYTDFIEQPVDYRGQTAHGSQVGIVGNHVAALGDGEARAGRGARMMLDSDGNEVAPAATGERRHSMLRIDSRGVPFEVEGPGAEGLKQSLEKERADAARALEAAEAKVSTIESELTEAQAKVDAAEKQIAELQSQLDAERDPAKRAKDTAELLELTEKAQIVSGKKVDMIGTPHEIRLAALKTGGEDVLDTIPSGRKEDSAYIEAYTAARFDAAYVLRKDARASVTSTHTTTTKTNNQDDPIMAALVKRDADRENRSRQLRGMLPIERS